MFHLLNSPIMFDPYLRYWLLTWTTYGTWLPGEDRGFVSPVRSSSFDPWQRRNVRGTDDSRSMAGLKRASQSRLKCPPILLSLLQAEALLDQFHETAKYRSWECLAVAIMRTHVHLLVEVVDDPDPEVILKDFKSYASRKLNTRWDRPVSDTWWTESGSKRKKWNCTAVVNAVRYVANQENPLVICVHSEWQHVLRGTDIARG
jgi:REP element-mobilizing transposase RayT